MRSFLSEFTRDIDKSRTVVVMDEDGLAPPRQYELAPHAVILRGVGLVLAVVILTFAVVALTPIRQLIPGYSTDQMRSDAMNNAARLVQLEDSLRLQSEYLSHLRSVVTGAVSDTVLPALTPAPPSTPAEIQTAAEAAGGESDAGQVTAGEARALQTTPVTYASQGGAARAGGISLPTLPPVEGFVTRPYNSRDEHFAVDVAVSEGTSVRSIGNGYVVLADWTQAGGYAVAIQHAGGYVTVYKHNSELLKQVGDRVRAQEPIARSGNTGEVTTGPHLHFELWRDGIPQDPREYILGW